MSDRPKVNAGDTYECAHCHGVFVADWDDADAAAEQAAVWAAAPDDEVAVICDNCYRKMREWARSDAPELLAGVVRREFDGPASAARESGVLAGWHMLMTGNVYYRDGRLWCPECDGFCPCSCCGDVALLNSNSGAG